MQTSHPAVVRPFLPPLLILLLLAAGCQRGPRWDRRIEAATPGEWAGWQRSNQESFSRAEWQEIEDACQDLKVRIIALREATGADAVNEALRSKIQGRTVREVLALAGEARLWRLNVERGELEKMIAGNATLRTKPGDTESAAYLLRKAREQQEKLEKVKAEIRATEDRLAGLAARA